MKISYNWLKQYHDLDLEPDKVAEILTGCGLEVESMEPFQSVKGGLRGVVIGEVMTCERHPGSDHLSLTTVEIADGAPLKIVCGASNVAKGQKVAVATVGAKLYFDDRELTLQRTKIRGEVSEGMICAEDELGLGQSHDGIMVLDPSATVGMPASEYFMVEEDVIFTIGLTPNRIDASSHAGVARDMVAVVNNFGHDGPRPASSGHLILPDVSSFKVDNNSRTIPVLVEDTEACPRYSGITVSGIHVADSPEWLKNRLMSVGLRPVNNIVDVTNYVLMELGQPLHAFDSDQIAGNKVIVKKYPAGTRFITLDNVERELSDNDLMICNAAGPMCIAGIFGGIRSGVTAGTTSVFIESACFDPRHIRRSSRAHGLQTDASFRFERGSDPRITLFALKRAAMLIKEIAGGEISSEIVDIYPDPLPPMVVDLSFKNLDRLIGKSINRDVIKSIISDLGMTLLEESPRETGFRIGVPSFKVDVTREADVIEEVLRIYGYNNIELSDEIKNSVSYTVKPDPEYIQNSVSDYLAAAGFNEIMNNSLTRSAYYAANKEYPLEQCVKMLNPISRDLDVMRQTLLFGAVETVVYNQNRKVPELRMFEFGRVYSTMAGKNDLLPGFHEEQHLALIMTGNVQPENWNITVRPVDFFDLKGYLEGILSLLSVNREPWTVQTFQSGQISNGLQYLNNGKSVAICGSVDDKVLKAFDCRQPVWYAEVNWDCLFSLIPVENKQYMEIPRFPEVRRDLALVVDRQVTFDELKRLAFRTEKKFLKQVGLFDVYEGEKIPAGKKSYAMSFLLRDEEKTLTDKEIEGIMNKLTQAMVTKYNALLR